MIKTAFQVAERLQPVPQFLLLIPNPSTFMPPYRTRLSTSLICMQSRFLIPVSVSICYARILITKTIFRFNLFAVIQWGKFVTLAKSSLRGQNTMGCFRYDMRVDGYCWLSMDVFHIRAHNKWLRHSRHRTLNCISVLLIIEGPCRKECRGSFLSYGDGWSSFWQTRNQSLWELILWWGYFMV